MKIQFQLLSLLRAISTSPPKSKYDGDLLRVKALCCVLAALVLLAFSLYSFGQLRSRDGVLFLALAALLAAGAPLAKTLSRRRLPALLFSLLLLGLTLCSTLLGSGGPFILLWGLFVPVAAIGLCGIQYGSIIGGLLAPCFFLILYSPLAQRLGADYPRDLRIFYPILYTVVYLMFFLLSYLQHRQLLEKNRNEQSLEKAVHQEYNKLMAMTTQTILSISNAIDARDPYTKRHSSRVAQYSVLLAKSLGWDERRTEQLYNIALLHDIGKIGISDSILNKHTALTPEEYETIKQHTVIGGEILKDLTLLPNASIGAVSHHERYDGTGYPYGLKGAQIPLEARIIGIADAFDAMNSSRIYRHKMQPATILQELENGRGRQFDPELLDKFLPIAKPILESDTL